MTQKPKATKAVQRFMVNHEAVGQKYKGDPISQAELGLTDAEWQRLVDLEAVVVVEDVPATAAPSEPTGQPDDKTGE